MSHSERTVVVPVKLLEPFFTRERVYGEKHLPSCRVGYWHDVGSPVKPHRVPYSCSERCAALRAIVFGGSELTV